MAVDIKLWEIKSNGSRRYIEKIESGNLSQSGYSEGDLQKWLAEKPEILDPQIIVIGTEIEGIDLLGINDEARVIVAELKKVGARDAIAQAIDYASRIVEKDEEWIFETYSRKQNKDLKEFFNEKFNRPLEQIYIYRPKILIVGTEPDEDTERMVKFLNGYELDINLVVLRYIKTNDGREFLARTVMTKSPSTPHPPPPNFAEQERRLLSIADEAGVREIVDVLRGYLKKHPRITREHPTKENYFSYYSDEGAIIFVGVTAEDSKSWVELKYPNLAKLKNRSPKEVEQWIKDKLKRFSPTETEKGKIFRLWISDKEEAELFLKEIDEFLKS